MMPADEARRMRPEYEATIEGRWNRRLNDTRKQVDVYSERAAADAAGLERDRKIYPMSTHNDRGEPMWYRSDAQKLLREDMKAGKHKEMTPSQLRDSREEYKQFSAKVFRDHIPQSTKRKKWVGEY